MNRRQYLALGACGVVGTAGCLESSATGSDGSIATRTIEIVERNPAERSDDDPDVEFRPESRTVIVSGIVETGNPCRVIALEEAKLDTDRETLVVSIGTKPTGDLLKRIIGCPDSLQVVRYRAAVTLNDRLPASVTATEIPAPVGEPRTARVDRTRNASSGDARLRSVGP